MKKKRPLKILLDGWSFSQWVESRTEGMKIVKEDLVGLGIKAKVYNYGSIKIKFNNYSDLNLCIISGLIKRVPEDQDGDFFTYIKK